MKFAAVIEYSQDKAKIAEHRPAHRQYLTSLKDKGQLAASGPFTDDWGALIIYEAPTMAEAEAILKADPFSKNGIFIQYTMRPWNAIFFNPSLWS